MGLRDAFLKRFDRPSPVLEVAADAGIDNRNTRADGVNAPVAMTAMRTSQASTSATLGVTCPDCGKADASEPFCGLTGNRHKRHVGLCRDCGAQMDSSPFCTATGNPHAPVTSCQGVTTSVENMPQL